MKVYDIDGVEFDKDPVDVAECVKSLCWTTELVDVEIKDMKKSQLMSFIEKNGIEIPDDATKVDDIKLHLMGMDLEHG